MQITVSFRLIFVVPAFLCLVTGIAFSQQPDRGVLLISVDGLKPEYIENAEALGLDIPHLRALREQGASAKGVRGVLPSVTYPSHTTVITGVWPGKHGIVNNRPFDPWFKTFGLYYWFTGDIKVPTLWEAAAGAGYRVSSISWPVSVGSDHIHANIPEYGGYRSPVDVKMTRGFATRGLMSELSEAAGEYLTDHTDPVPRDWARTRYTLEIIKRKKPGFLTLHLTCPDGLQHRNGPYTRAAHEGIQEVDKMIGLLQEAFQEVYPGGVVCIVSDHGFAEVDQVLKLQAAFVRAGLISLESEGSTLEASGIKDWLAIPARAGASSAVYLKDPEDNAVRSAVRKLLDSLAADPAQGIAAILEKDEIVRQGGDPEADFWVDVMPGFTCGNSLDGPLTEPISKRGAHGYAPGHAEMNSTFIITGKGIEKGLDLGIIDMRSIAPTIARVLGVSFPSADLPALPVLKE